MASFPIGIRFEPILSVDKLNAVLDHLRTALGTLGKDIKPIDTASLTSSFAKIDAQIAATEAKFRELPTVAGAAGDQLKNEFPAKVKAGMDKAVEAGNGFAQRFKDIGSGAISVLTGGLLVNGVQSLVGGFESLINKGIEVKKMQEDMKVAFATAGVAQENLNKVTQANTARTLELANKYAVARSDINASTKAFLSLGGSTDGLAQKQEILIGLAARLGGNYELAGKALAKSVDPEIGAQLTKFGIKFATNASELDRFNQLVRETSPTLKQMAENADGPIGSIERFKQSLLSIGTTIAVMLIDLISPFLPFLSSVANAITNYIIVPIKQFGAFLQPVIPIILTIAAAFALWAFAPELITLITSAVEALTAAEIGLEAVNPLAWVAIALAAIVVLGKVLYDNFQPVHDFVDALVTKFKPILSNIGDIVLTIGKIWFTWIILPFKVAYELIVSFFSLFSSGSSDSSDSLHGLGGAIDFVAHLVEGFKASLAGLLTFIGSLSGTISALFKGDFAGAFHNLIKGVQDATDTAFRSLQTSAVEDAATKMGDILSKKTTSAIANAKVDVTPLLDEYQKAQDKINALQEKATSQHGFLSNSDKKALEDLTAQAQSTSAKIAEIAPQAVAGIHSQVDAAGNITKVYDLNIDKVQEFADSQKKTFGDDLLAKQQEYSKNLTLNSRIYAEQQQDLVKLKDNYDAALKTGDTKKIEEAKDAYDKLKETADKSGEAMKKGFEDGATAGLLTQESIREVAKAQGITEDQAKQGFLAKNFSEAAAQGKLTAASAVEDRSKAWSNRGSSQAIGSSSELKKAAEAGNGSKEVIALLAEKYGTTAAEAKKIYDEQVRITGEIERSKQSAQDLGVAFDANLAKMKAEVTQIESNAAALLKRAKDARKNGDEQTAADLEGQAKIEIAKGKATESQVKADDKSLASIKKSIEGEKEKAKTITERLLAEFEKTKLTTEQENEKLRLQQSQAALAQGRKLNDVDELAFIEKQNKGLDTQKAKLESLFKITTNSSGNVEIGIKGIKKEDQNKIIKQYNEVVKADIEAGIKELDLNAKLNPTDIQVQTEALNAKLKPLEIQLRTTTDLNETAKLLQQEVDIRKDFEERMHANTVAAQIAFDAETNVANKFALKEKLKAAQSEEDKARSETEKAVKDSQTRQFELIDSNAKKELEAVKESQKKQAELFLAVSNTTEKVGESVVVTEKQREIDALDKLKQDALISDQSYNDRKAAIEKKSADEIGVIQAEAAGRKLAIENETALAEAKIQEETLAKKLALTTDSKEAQKLQDELDGIHKVISEKGDVTKTAMLQLGSGLSNIANNLIQHDPDAAKKGMKDVLATLGGYLQRLASAAAIRIVLSSEPITALAAAAGPFAPVIIAGLTAVINAAVNALTAPIISGLLSFSTGGIVDSPTLAMVGDRAATSGRDNTEFILGSDQMQAALQQALVQYDSIVAAEIRLLRDDIRRQPVIVMVDGVEILTAVRTAETHKHEDRSRDKNSFHSFIGSIMKVLILFLALCAVTLSAQEPTPISPTKTSITELGLTFPLKSSTIKNYIEAHSVSTLPLTSGYGSGVQVGRHMIIGNQATVGLIAAANMFIGTDSVVVTQIYQLDIYVTGRLYFGQSWRGGFYAELGAGPELSAAKFTHVPFVFQVNIGARLGFGYNYRFTDDVTIGAAILAVPSLSSNNFLDGTKLSINMLW